MRFRSAQRLILWVGGIAASLILLVLLILALRFFPLPGHKAKGPPAVSLDRGVEEFFQVYWQRPIAPQGLPPPGYTEKEASIRSEACGSCHPRQYEDWKESLHSKAMGPGPWGQIIDLMQDSPGEASLCVSCHTPLSEQFPLLTKKAARNEESYEKNPQFDPELQLKGITVERILRYTDSAGREIPGSFPLDSSRPGEKDPHMG